MEHSPYTPGAGFMPPQLAGRDGHVQRWQVMLNDVGAVGRLRARDTVLTGPRGVGKTALLSRLEELCETAGFDVVSVQAVKDHGGLMRSVVQAAADRAAQGSGPWGRLQQALSRISSVEIGVAGVSATVDTAPSTKAQDATAFDPFQLATALRQLAIDIRTERGRGGLMLSVDEMQVTSPADMALLAATLHQLNRPRLADAPVVFAGAGLPNTMGKMVESGVTHPDRLFRFDVFPLRLTPAETEQAVVLPANERGVTWHPDAVAELLDVTQGYPAHVQLLADACWTQAPVPTITPSDVAAVTGEAVATITVQTLEPQWNDLPGREKEYLAALAMLGGRAAGSDVAAVLGVRPADRSAVRSQLINARGMIFAPTTREVELSMPLLKDYVGSVWDTDRQELDHPDQYASRHDLTMAIIRLTQDRITQQPVTPPQVPPPSTTAHRLPQRPPSLPPGPPDRGISGPSM